MHVNRGRQLRPVPRPDQPDGRGAPRPAAEHGLLPGLPPQSRSQPAAARQGLQPDLDWNEPGAAKSSCGRRFVQEWKVEPLAKLLRLPPMKPFHLQLCPGPDRAPSTGAAWTNWPTRPAFREWVEREFPEGASELADPVSRRHFVKIMSASFLLAGLGPARCRRPEEKIHPFAKMPEDYVHGVPQYYATAMPDAARRACRWWSSRTTAGPSRSKAIPEHPGQQRRAPIATPRPRSSISTIRTAPRDSCAGGNDDHPRGAIDFLDELAKRFAANGGEGSVFPAGAEQFAVARPAADSCSAQVPEGAVVRL